MRTNNYHPVLLTVLVATLLSCVAGRASAQIAYDGHGERIEVFGLHHWTLKALQDSIQHRVSGQTLEDAACMVTLRDSLHFADAEVQTLISQSRPGDAIRRYLIIKVIEPQDASLVRWRAAPRDSFTVLRPDYAHVILPVTDSLGRFLIGRFLDPLQYYSRDSAARAAAIRGRPETARADAERLWSFLNAHRTDADRRTALTALRQDGPYVNRMVAAAILANFADQDSTWWALTDALRDGDESVRSAVQVVLSKLPARVVNWEPVAPTLRALLGGTNVSATQDVLEMLDRTQITAALAKPLLHNNGTWVLTHLRAEYPGAEYSAHALLVRLNGGRDLGSGDAKWKHWIATL